MSLRDAKLIAFDGTHAGGKTTLIYAVAALLRREGVHVTKLGEPARTSPFVDDVVIHKTGDFDMLLELDLFAAFIMDSVRAARSYRVVLTDKTPTSVLAYCKLLVTIKPGSWDAEMLEVMEAFCRSWNKAYEAIYYCQDYYGDNHPGDDYRSKVDGLHTQVDTLVRAEYERLKQPLIEIPRGLELDERAAWVISSIKQQHLI